MRNKAVLAVHDLRTTTTISGISSMATRQFLAEVTADWRSTGGCNVRFEFVGGVDAAKRVQDGEAFDLAVLASDAIDKLARAGSVIPASVVALARSSVAIAVPHGAPRPPVDSKAALLAALRVASRIGYSTGPSGKALLQLFANLGIYREIFGRLVQAPPGVPVGALLARGEVVLGFQQQSELMHLEGIDLLGPMPPGLEIVTTFSAAVCSVATRPRHAEELLAYLCSSETADAKRTQGMEPA